MRSIRRTKTTLSCEEKKATPDTKSNSYILEGLKSSLSELSEASVLRICSACATVTLGDVYPNTSSSGHNEEENKHNYTEVSVQESEPIDAHACDIVYGLSPGSFAWLCQLAPLFIHHTTSKELSRTGGDFVRYIKVWEESVGKEKVEDLHVGNFSPTLPVARVALNTLKNFLGAFSALTLKTAWISENITAQDITDCKNLVEAIDLCVTQFSQEDRTLSFDRWARGNDEFASVADKLRVHKRIIQAMGMVACALEAGHTPVPLQNAATCFPNEIRASMLSLNEFTSNGRTINDAICIWSGVAFSEKGWRELFSENIKSVLSFVCVNLTEECRSKFRSMENYENVLRREWNKFYKDNDMENLAVNHKTLHLLCMGVDKVLHTNTHSFEWFEGLRSMAIAKLLPANNEVSHLVDRAFFLILGDLIKVQCALGPLIREKTENVLSFLEQQKEPEIFSLQQSSSCSSHSAIITKIELEGSSLRNNARVDFVNKTNPRQDNVNIPEVRSGNENLEHHTPLQEDDRGGFYSGNNEEPQFYRRKRKPTDLHHSSKQSQCFKNTVRHLSPEDMRRVNQRVKAYRQLVTTVTGSPEGKWTPPTPFRKKEINLLDWKPEINLTGVVEKLYYSLENSVYDSPKAHDESRWDQEAEMGRMFHPRMRSALQTSLDNIRGKLFQVVSDPLHFQPPYGVFCAYSRVLLLDAWRKLVHIFPLTQFANTNFADLVLIVMTQKSMDYSQCGRFEIRDRRLRVPQITSATDEVVRRVVNRGLLAIDTINSHPLSGPLSAENRISTLHGASREQEAPVVSL